VLDFSDHLPWSLSRSAAAIRMAAIVHCFSDARMTTPATDTGDLGASTVGEIVERRFWRRDVGVK
jgi:hypothetical protein